MAASTIRAASGGGRKRGRRRAVMSDINVTPFVDVMLVLLIVFMVSAPLLTVGVPIDLPQSQAKALEQNNEPLTVSIDVDGKVYLQKNEIHLDDLVPKLKAIIDARGVSGAAAADERIYVVPRALVYKDLSVHMNIHMERPASPRAHWKLIPMIRLTGPGRVAIQSQYEFEPEAHWGWDELGPDGSWRNWNPDPNRWRRGIKEREPLYP